jgi:antitoxin MazE
VRITAPLTMAADVAQGNPVTREVVPKGLLVRVGGKPNISLTQKLKAYDPQVHGGEVMADGRSVGAEAPSNQECLDHQAQHGTTHDHLNHASLEAKQRDGSNHGQGR